MLLYHQLCYIIQKPLLHLYALAYTHMRKIPYIPRSLFMVFPMLSPPLSLPPPALTHDSPSLYGQAHLDAI